MKQEVERGTTITHKQETLEEAAERMYSEEELQQKINAHLEVAKDLWLSAIKEQKRMYSEEEVGELLYNVIGEYGKHYGIMIDGKMLNDLFEQFKKK
mgnify:CR=1 FL=1